MQQKSSKKNIILISVIVVCAGLAYYFYSSGTPASDSQVVSTDAPLTDSTVIGSQILVLLNQVKSLKIDQNFFKTQVYSSLVDHTVPVYDQNIGKPNPFLDPNPKSAGTSH